MKIQCTEEEIIIFDRARKAFGPDIQECIAFEECSELIQAISKYKRDLFSEEHVCEEIADVILMMHQLAILYGVDTVNEYIDFKFKRLIKRIELLESEKSLK